MSRSTNVLNRSRGRIFETTIRKKCSEHELNMVIHRLRTHADSNVAAGVFLVIGKSRKFVGHLNEIDLNKLRQRLKKALQRGTVGIEVVDLKTGGALHAPHVHSAKYELRHS